jgi:hypothetical protein
MSLSAPSAIYTHEHLVAATGRSPATIQSWLSRNFFVPSFETGKGRGARRLYSGRAILEIGLASNLADFGVPFPQAHAIARTVLTYGASFAPQPEWPGEFVDDFNFWVALVQHEDGFRIATTAKAFHTLPKLVEAMPSDVEMALLVDIGKISRQIEAYLESISTTP